MKNKEKSNFAKSFKRSALFGAKNPVLAKIIVAIAYPYVYFCMYILVRKLKQSLDKNTLLDDITEEQLQATVSKCDFYFFYAVQLSKYKKIFSFKWFQKSVDKHLKYTYEHPVIKKVMDITYLSYREKYWTDYKNPQQDIMLTVKEANHYMVKRKKRRKFWGFKDNGFKNDEQIIKWFSKYHKKCNKECPDIKHFMHLCSLDNKYGFWGMSTLKNDGPTVINIPKID